MFSLAIVCLGLAASGQLMKKVEGNGNVVTQDRTVEAFTELTNSGSFDVILTDGSQRAVKVEAEENLQPYIVTEVKGDLLAIHGKMGVNIQSHKKIRIFVTATGLTAVRQSGSGNIKTENQLKAGKNFEISSSGSGNTDIDVITSNMEASLSGSGNMHLRGETKELNSKISGSGNIKAKDLKSEITSVKISGSGNAEVVATRTLDSKISGSGGVSYWGDAQVESKTVGSGRVKKQG